jgi:hypothetical protein
MKRERERERERDSESWWNPRTAMAADEMVEGREK